MILKRILPCVLILFLVLGCKTTSSLQQEPETEKNLCPNQIQWTQLQEGFCFTEYTIPDLQVYWACVKIDLQTPNLTVKVYPESQAQIGQTIKVSNFSKENKTVAAINTTPFDKNQIPMGITQIDGQIVTPKNSRYQALLLKKTKSGYSCEIVNQGDGPSDYINQANCTVIGGYFQILENGQSLSFFRSRRSRTAAGISQDKRYLYLFEAVPLFSPTDSNGLFYEECATILCALGSYNALTCDGGTSTSLTVYNQQKKAPLFQKQVSSAIGFAISN